MSNRQARASATIAVILACTAAPAGATVVVSGCANAGFCTLTELTPRPRARPNSHGRCCVASVGMITGGDSGSRLSHERAH